MKMPPPGPPNYLRPYKWTGKEKLAVALLLTATGGLALLYVVFMVMVLIEVL